MALPLAVAAVLAPIAIGVRLGRGQRSRPSVLALVAALAVGVAAGLACVPFLDGKPALRRLSGFEPMVQPALAESRLVSGLVVPVPGPSQCRWDGPLPCTPGPNRARRLRRGGDLGAGFVLEPGVGPDPDA